MTAGLMVLALAQQVRSKCCWNDLCDVCDFMLKARILKERMSYVSHACSCLKSDITDMNSHRIIYIGKLLNVQPFRQQGAFVSGKVI